MKPSMQILLRLHLVLLGMACTHAMSQPTKEAPPQAKTPVVVVKSWPTQPIRLLVGFPAGSVQDISARIIAEPLSKALGQPVIVENKVGASGSIAAALVARATDQHTFGVMNNSQLTIAKLLNPAVAYNPETDLAPIALIGTTPMVMVITNAAAGKNRAEWLTWLRGQGDKANFGSPGVGTPGHLGMELIKSRSGVMAAHIPYPGNPQVITAILGDEIQTALLPAGLAMQQVRAGKMRAIGITDERRITLASEISALAPGLVQVRAGSPVAGSDVEIFTAGLPTMRDVNVLGADIELMTALAGPASMNPAARDKLSAAVIEVVKADETRQRLVAAGWQPKPSTAEYLRFRIRRETQKFGGIIMMRSIRSDS